MLSICIPIYNFDVTGLVVTLHQQAVRQNIAAEVVCIDDCSDEAFRAKNKDICNTYGKYIQLEENVGRAKIRNLFLQYAIYDYLLFLDCDSVLIASNFVKKYTEAIIKSNAKVLCGGRIYEDTLFGFQLKENHIKILHIDNPILNGYLEDNDEFITKTELGLDNLVCILQFLNYDPEFIRDVNILKFHQKCRKYRLDLVIIFLFSFLKPVLRLNLSKGFANLFWFDFYKLGYFSTSYVTQSK